MIQNPILRGFHPDPSICRVGEDYYLVTSSFSFFPGVPIYHSRGLMRWERIGHVLSRKSQLTATYEDLSGGIFAPTIRWHDGIFYMITTNMTTGQNFFCTAENPAGEWSDPVVLDGVGGIDPSLFWDEDGTCYYTGTAPWNDSRFEHPQIVCGELDLSTGKLVGQLRGIGSGYAKASTSPEGPHLYKKDGWYYLLIAEGGTEHDHAVTISRSRNVFGPYEQCPRNPVLTHRHLGKEYPICNVGHADLVECQDGFWYAVCLGSRLVDGYHKLLGRETFLLPVVWEEGWPVFSPGTGRVEAQYPAPAFAQELPGAIAQPEAAWNTAGTPYEDFFSIEEGQIRLRMLETALVPWEFEGEVFDFFGHMQKLGRTRKSMPFLGKRLREPRFTLETQMQVTLRDSQAAGIAIMQNNANQLRLEARAGVGNTVCLRAVRVIYSLTEGRMHYAETVEGSISLPACGVYRLRMMGSENRYSFFAAVPGAPWQEVASGVDGHHLGNEAAGGFIGAYVGIFATGNGAVTDNAAVFQNFSIKEG